MPHKPIQSIQHLKEACLTEPGDYVHFRMVLAQGLAYSSKRILYFPKDDKFYVINEIDESYQDDLTQDDLKSKTRIVEAIEKNAFFHEII